MPDDTIPGAIRPADLRDYTGTLYIANRCGMTISFDNDKGTIFTLPAKGREDSIQVLPLDAARDPGLQKMWRRGEISVSTDPAIEEELTLMEQRAIQERDREHDELVAVMDTPPSENDLVPAQCLHCQKTTFVSSKSRDANDEPILCEDHKDLKSFFVPEPFMDEADGTERTRWVSTTVNTKRASHAAKSVAKSPDKG
jgi:hypothetical protein